MAAPDGSTRRILAHPTGTCRRPIRPPQGAGLTAVVEPEERPALADIVFHRVDPLAGNPHADRSAHCRWATEGAALSSALAAEFGTTARTRRRG